MSRRDTDMLSPAYWRARFEHICNPSGEQPLCQYWLQEIGLLLAIVLVTGLLGVLVDSAVVAALLGVLLYTALLLARLFLATAATFRRGGLQTLANRNAKWGLPGLLWQREKLFSQANRKRQKKLARSLRRYHDSAMSVPDAMVVLTSNHEIEWLNHAATNVLGLAQSDIGQRLDQLWPTMAFVNWLEHQGANAPLEIAAPNDQRRMLSLRIEPYGSKRRLLMGRDVTDLHRLQGLRQNFVANVSHELRTPLTVLTGYVETLLDDPDDLDPTILPILQSMNQQSERMRRIVDDLLLLSRLETSRPDAELFECIDMRELLQVVVRDARSLSGAEAHEITLDVTSNARLRAVRREMHSAISNLVFNAVKYTPEGGRIAVRWHSGIDGQMIFSVTDTGIGIEEKHIPRLTERFYRIDVGRSRSRGGTGLGLAIVKHVALRHDARLEIESTPGQGSCFAVRFPPEKRC